MASGGGRKIGLLGAGYISDLHARCVKARGDLQLAAVCDRSVGRARALAQLYDIPQVFASLDELLAADVDVVHVLTPPDQHFQATRRVLESGRHAFVEKPMALASADCNALAELAAQKELRLSANHNFLFGSSAKRLLKHAADGTLGRLDHISIKWMAPLELLRSGPLDNWIVREPQNVLFEVGPHLLSFVVALVGRLEKLKATASRPVDLPGGARVYRHWHIYGTRDHTAVDVTLSLSSGPSLKAVFVRGQAAVAACDFGRDIYQLVESRSAYPALENFNVAVQLARQALGSACRGALRFVLHTLAKRPAQDPFAASIQTSINAFYDSLDGASATLLNARFASDVIAECEKIAGDALGTVPQRIPGARELSSIGSAPKVVVFGGTGFIGRHLVHALVRRGLSVRVATRNRESARMLFDGLPVDVAQGDLADREFIQSALEGIETVYDLAKAEGRTWQDYVERDIKPTQALAECALAAGIRRFIYTGTIASHYSGSARDTIHSESAFDPQIERRDHYARSKAACEALLLDMHRNRGLPVVIFRPGIVVGAGASPMHWGVGMFVSETRVHFWGEGRNPLPFVLVDDVVAGLMLALDAPNIDGQTFLLTDEPLLTARDYVKALSEAWQVKIRATPTAAWRFYAAELLKEGLKHAIRHRNRRKPSYRDWASRSQLARYDSAKTRKVLGWKPCGSRDLLIDRGIAAPAREWML